MFKTKRKNGRVIIDPKYVKDKKGRVVQVLLSIEEQKEVERRLKALEKLKKELKDE